MSENVSQFMDKIKQLAEDHFPYLCLRIVKQAVYSKDGQIYVGFSLEMPAPMAVFAGKDSYHVDRNYTRIISINQQLLVSEVESVEIDNFAEYFFKSIWQDLVHEIYKVGETQHNKMR